MSMNVRYFSKTSDIGPSSRYRIFQYLPGLERSGIRVSVRPLFGPTYFRLLERRAAVSRTLARAIYVFLRFLRRIWDVWSATGADLIVVEGQLFPYMGLAVERLLAKRRPLVVELDDAIYLTKGQERKIPALLQLSVGAIVGNNVLAEFARSYAPHVTVIPTVVDTSRFRPRDVVSTANPRTANQPITIVWIGLDYNLSYVQALTPVLRRLQAEHPIRVRIICGTAPACEGVEVEFRRWRYETEVTDLQDCAIGIMPLPDNEWARAKCGLKLLQYMAVGIPAVASPVGVNRDIVHDGVNGFLASTDDEWHEKLTALCRDAELRSRMGGAARRTVVEDYSLAAWTPRLAASYRDMLVSRRVAAHQPVLQRPIRP